MQYKLFTSTSIYPFVHYVHCPLNHNQGLYIVKT